MTNNNATAMTERALRVGELYAETSSVHRRIPVTELERYQTEMRSRRRTAMTELAADITE